MKTRFDVIQYLIDTNKYTRYLEIGVRVSENNMSIEHIKCEHKDGVDPVAGRCNYTMTSNQFFEQIPETQKYDIIFVDGDHEKNQVEIDIYNSLKHLNSGGVIVCHDVNPPTERHLASRYCHNAWETWVKLRQTRPDLEMYALNVDLVGVIRQGNQTLYTSNVEYTWSFLDANREKLLNVISVDKFKEIFN